MSLCVAAGGCIKNKNLKYKPFSFKPSLSPPDDSRELGFLNSRLLCFSSGAHSTKPSPCRMPCSKDAARERKTRCPLAVHTHILEKTVSGKSGPSAGTAFLGGEHQHCLLREDRLPLTSERHSKIISHMRALGVFTAARRRVSWGHAPKDTEE